MPIDYEDAEDLPVKLPLPRGMIAGAEAKFFVDPIEDNHTLEIGQALCGFAFDCGQRMAGADRLLDECLERIDQLAVRARYR